VIWQVFAELRVNDNRGLMTTSFHFDGTP